MPDSPTPAENAIVRAAAALGEHFDSVLIVATIDRPDGTEMHHRLRGNTFASEGAARRWLRHRERSADRRDAAAERRDDIEEL